MLRYTSVAQGVVIDDGTILKDKWESGMGVQGLNYCESVTNDSIWNYQLVVGYEDPATHFELLTHGNKI